MLEVGLDYWNKLASQIIGISSLLGGFSIAIIASLLVAQSNTQLTNNILKAVSLAAGCFLVTIFAMTSIYIMTIKEYPFKVVEQDLNFARIVSAITFLLGIVSLSVVIALSGWTKSRSTGIFTTLVGVVTLIIIIMMLI